MYVARLTQLVGSGFREPINVVISGHSDPAVLSEQGFLDYAQYVRGADQVAGLFV